MNIVVGTRGSKLALTQTNGVVEQLREKNPQVTFEVKIIKTMGDRIQDMPLDKMGDKGIFTKEIEAALLNKEIDLAVHSMKDMPSELPEGLKFGSSPKRADPRDVLILKEGFKSLSELPYGARVATGSKRRKYQLLQLRPDLNIVPIRGNVDTRLRKLKEENLDGIVLAAAGLVRLGMEDVITEYLPLEKMIPAPSQGILAIEIRENDKIIETMLQGIEDQETMIQREAERSFMDSLGGSCHVPMGAYCRIDGQHLHLLGVYGDENGNILIKREESAPLGCEKKLGEELGSSMRKELNGYER